MNEKSMNVVPIGIIIAAVFCIILLGSCSAEQTGNDYGDGKIHILCTTFPIYDWTRQITRGLDEYFEITLLMDQGTDLHNYQPTAEDIILMSEADLLISIGGESDRWMEDVISAVPEEKRAAQRHLELMDILGDALREEEYVDGMEHSRGDEEDGSRREETEYDEHIWLSVKNAEFCVRAIGDAVWDMTVEESVMQAAAGNTELYLEELKELDREYADTLGQADGNMLIFGGRFPFLYLVKDYGLEYYAAFQGCSAETGASFETIVFLAEKLDEYGLSAVLVIENEDSRVASTIIENTAGKDQIILALNSMQSITVKDIEQGADYLGIMRDNLSVLSTALGTSYSETYN